MTLLRHAFRRVCQTPRLSVAAILCIALGAAATATITTLVNATLVRPAPFRDAGRLVRVWFEEPGINPRISFSIPDLADYRSMRSFDAFLGTARVRASVRVATGAERVRGEGVSPGYFETLGIAPAIGRGLVPSDHRSGAPPVVVLTDSGWRRLFGGDAHVIGREFRTERATYTVVGVGPSWFGGTVEDDIVDFFIPLEHYEPRSLITTRTARPAWVVARLGEGVTLDAATAEARAVHAEAVRTHPDIYRRWQVRIEPFGENWRQGLRTGGGLLLSASILLLVVAAINVGCLLLARARERRRELAVRAALGAGRGRLVVELLAEAAILVCAGAMLGVALAPRLLQAFMAIVPPAHFAIPGYVRLAPDAVTLAVTLATLAVAALIAGTVPALVGLRVAPADVLRAGGRTTIGGRAETRWGAWLIASETALTLTLLVAGTLLAHSYGRLTWADLGFDRARLARVAVTLSPLDSGGPARLPQMYARLQQELSAVAGVGRLGLVHPTLPPYDGYRARVRPGGVELAHAPEGLDAGIHLANEGLLPMLGVPVVAGRNLQQGDEAVAVVSRTFARVFGEPEQALGRTVTLTSRDPSMPAGAFRIVGVAENVAWDGLSSEETRQLIPGTRGGPRAARYDVYVPLERYAVPVVSIGVWTSGDPAAAIEAVRRRLSEIAPASAVHWTEPMEDAIALEYSTARFYAVLVGVFSWSALLITSIGLFALLSEAATSRRSEIGLRLALGASRGSTAVLLARTVTTPLLIGLVAGLGLAALVNRTLAAILYDVGGFDPITVLVAVLAWGLVACLAGIVPARRVMSVDPMVALRAE